MKVIYALLSTCMLMGLTGYVQAHPFERGQVRIAAGGGGGVGGWSAGLSGGYFILDGLELGVGTTYISTNDLKLLQGTGSTTYVFLPDASMNPYAGVFLRHWFVLEGNADPQSSMGIRGGLYHLSGNGLMLGFGVVQETILDCNDSGECQSIYPEFSLSIVF